MPSQTALRRLNTGYYAITAVQTMAIMLPLAVIILHMTERGIALGLIGLVIALRSILVILLEIPSGALADSIGRKPVALISQGLTFVSILALLFLGAPGGALATSALLVLYVVSQGVGAAMHSGALDAWYVDALRRTAPDASLSANLARVEVVIGFASLAGVAGGAALPSLLAGLELAYPLAGYGAALAAGLLLRAITFALTAWVVREPATPARQRPAMTTVLRDATELVRRPDLALLCVASFTTGAGLITLETLWQPAAQASLGFTPATSGVVAGLGAAYGAALAIGPVIMLALVERFPRKLPLLAAVSKIGIGAGLVWLGASSGAWDLGAALALGYLAIAGHGAPFETLFNERIPDERRSVMLSVANLVNFAGIAAGSLVIGVSAEVFGIGQTLVATGGLIAVTALAYVPLMGRVPNPLPHSNRRPHDEGAVGAGHGPGDAGTHEVAVD